LNKKNAKQENNYSEYYSKSSQKEELIPNVKGMAGMDAVSLLENYGASGNPAAGATVTNQISAPAGVTELQLKFTTVNCGITLSVQPLNRNLKASFINLRTPTSIGAPGDGPGTICMDDSMVYVCVGTYDGSTPIWGRLGGDNGSIWALS
jgi:hypothetical protein